MKKTHYDVMIIGGGTGGLRTAIASVHKKAKTVLIEPGVLGGTCLNTGCIPTKAMLQAAHVYQQALNSDEFGVKTGKVTVDFPKLMQRVNGIVKTGQDHIKAGTTKIPLTIIREPATFVDAKTVHAGDQTISADNVIIATGAKNFIPPINGLDDVPYITNESVLKLKKLPKSLIMLGGGYISMEFATFFAQLGTKVTVLERMPGVLGMLDDDVREVLLNSFDQMGINVLTNVNICEVKKTKTGVTVVHNDVRDGASKKKTLSAQNVFAAMGRAPNTKSLDLHKAGVDIGHRGEIIVDDMMRSSQSHIFAIGDVTGKTMFAHAVKRQSGVALDNAVYGDSQKFPFDMVPWAAFTHPVVSGIGLSEKQAQQQNIKYGLMKAPFSRAGRATVIGETAGFVKVLFNPRSRKILGASIVGPNADDIIHEFVAVMNTKTPKIDVIQQAIHVHPTLSEVLDNLKEVRQ